MQTQLEAALPNLQVECIPIVTSGDRDLISPIHEIGGKGLFIKEIEKALLDGEVDIAVHSLKDITSATPDALSLRAFLKSESFLDALILAPPFRSFHDLPPGTILATGSLRRQALLKRLRPEIKTIDIRGNINTRMKKLDRGDCDGLILAEAGLMRLGMEERIAERFDPHIFTPAPGQGVIALEIRTDDHAVRAVCDAINDPQQHLRSTMEMEFLNVLGLDCKAPVGAFTFIENESIHLKVFISNQAMMAFFEDDVIAVPEERLSKARALGETCLHWLNRRR
ncbi:MAG: hydroxymethylbilane synthase [Waddliaceae bacterium]